VEVPTPAAKLLRLTTGTWSSRSAFVGADAVPRRRQRRQSRGRPHDGEVAIRIHLSGRAGGGGRRV